VVLPDQGLTALHASALGELRPLVICLLAAEVAGAVRMQADVGWTMPGDRCQRVATDNTIR
jgi:hypothetical protein